LLIIDDMGMKQLPKRSGECLFEIVLQSSARRLGQAPRRCPQRHRDPGPLPAPRRPDRAEGQKLPPESSFSSEQRRGVSVRGGPTQRQTRHEGRGVHGFKTSQREGGRPVIQNQPRRRGRPAARPAKTKRPDRAASRNATSH
jgi:hypothetical protein